MDALDLDRISTLLLLAEPRTQRTACLLDPSVEFTSMHSAPDQFKRDNQVVHASNFDVILALGDFNRLRAISQRQNQLAVRTL